ncbi:hypothetical protein LguiA_029614 [Lonicera macranthoides]
MQGLIYSSFLAISIDQSVITNNVWLKAPIHHGIKRPSVLLLFDLANNIHPSRHCT